MTDPLRTARKEMILANAKRAALISEVKARQPHLSRDQIEDVLDALLVLGKIDL